MSNPKFAWSQFIDLCETLRELMYGNCDLPKAKNHLPRLEASLAELPDNDKSIIRTEAFAIYHELKEELEQAIKCRMREVELMEELY